MHSLKDLRQRVQATKWPDKETVADQSQGTKLSNLQGLVKYWGTSYDWRKAEAKLNAYPQFITNIDGVDIHFIHVRSKERNAMPLILTHGWPGSIFEFIKIGERNFADAAIRRAPNFISIDFYFMNKVTA